MAVSISCKDVANHRIALLREIAIFKRGQKESSRQLQGCQPTWAPPSEPELRSEARPEVVVCAINELFWAESSDRIGRADPTEWVEGCCR
jgi:hypothetical protein